MANADREKEIIREMETIGNVVVERLDDVLPEELGPEVIGTMMAVMDALFAIRNATTWRGESDPQKIAEKLLSGLGLE